VREPEAEAVHAPVVPAVKFFKRRGVTGSGKLYVFINHLFVRRH
jgi:hypothetical protein